MSRNAWVVSVDMGYGHARAAYALRELAHGGVIYANKYPGIPAHDRKIWERGRAYYEAVSQMQPLPVVGEAIFDLLVDRFQRISSFYPRRDLSAPSLQSKQIYHSIEKQGVGRDLIERLSNPSTRAKLGTGHGKHLPLICTFFLPAFAAEVYDYPGDIYLVVCDADISRAWAPRDPRSSRIKYFASNGRVVERLRLYGVRSENIYLTGFPLPKELVGGPSAATVKEDLARRICNLDPQGVFWEKYGSLLRATLRSSCVRHKPQPVHLVLSIGGAGAQKALALEMVKSLREKIRRHKVRVTLVAGVRKDVARYFSQGVRRAGIDARHRKGAEVLYRKTKEEYFEAFAKLLHTTDILWTKPSEMSFYTGLGIPVLMAPPIGSQEDFNRQWLIQVGGGVDALPAAHISEWLFDWINAGALARMAWNGFVDAPTHGAYRIEEVLTGKPYKLATLPMII